MIPHAPLLVTAVAALGLTVAHAEPDRMPVADPRPLMVQALQSADGAAHGVLAGAFADAITARFKAGSPVYIDVTTVRRYRQPGCSRLRVLFWQDGVLLPGAKEPKRQTIEFGIDYCLDGQPPQSRS